MANNRPKSDCKGDSIYPWSCSQIELKCTTMTQPLICEYVRRSGGTVSLNRMPHRNNHLIYEAEGSPLTWFHSSLFCTCTFCPELLTHFGKCYGYLLHSPAVTAAVISVFFFSTKKKGVFLFPSSHINWQPGKTHFAKLWSAGSIWFMIYSSCSMTESLGLQWLQCYLQLISTTQHF